MKKKIWEVFDFSRSSRAVTVLILELFFGFVVVFGSLLVFWGMAEDVLEKETIFFDSIVANSVLWLRSPQMTDVMSFFSFLGGTFFLTGAIMVTIVLLWKQHRKDAIMFGFIFLSGVVLNLLLKEIFQRPRPAEPLIIESFYSFPSGHAMNAMVFYGALAFFVFWHMRNRKQGVLLCLLAFLLVGMIGVSRVYLGVHFPSDVLAGFLAGLCWMGVVILLEKTLLFFRLFRDYESKKEY